MLLRIEPCRLMGIVPMFSNSRDGNLTLVCLCHVRFQPVFAGKRCRNFGALSYKCQVRRAEFGMIPFRLFQRHCNSHRENRLRQSIKFRLGIVPNVPIHIVYELDTLACKARGNFGRNHHSIIGLQRYTVLMIITDSVKPQRARFGTMPPISPASGVTFIPIRR
jgi:hypothetical protein